VGGEQDPRITDLGYGCGDLDPDTGLYEWYEDVPDIARGGARALSWCDVFDQWPLVEACFHQEFGIDLSRRKVRRRTTWRTFRVRVSHLLSEDTALRRHFRDQQRDDEP
jgi:hypothetical protein